MSQTDPERWSCKPGSFDALNARQLFPADNEWGIPMLQRASVQDTPAWLAPYKTRIRSQERLEGAIHFFLDDYRFEVVWNRPHKALEGLRLCPMLLSPDFSLYRDWPRSLQIWNTYRNRWCGAFWQLQGLSVIPTVSWSTPDSYDFCFCGVETHSLIAISSVGTRVQPEDQHWFMRGFREMVQRLQPSRVLCYGQAPREAYDLAEVITYPTRWEGIAAARNHGYQIDYSREERDGTPWLEDLLEAPHGW